ncbi:hypothetical protein SEPCBS119000_006756 [Sporothrix epigloea]|uniref:Uncharacterized protein n=1 Tax=Sporothrix epigloea TaxID=1892477 RepID=A0ABP0E5A5_9PEZI
MVHHPAGEDYGEYKQLLLTISSRLEGVRLRQVPGSFAPRPANHTSPADPDAMDLRAGRTVTA